MAESIILKNIQELVTLRNALVRQGRHLNDETLSIIENSAMICRAGKVTWVGPMKELSAAKKKYGKGIQKELNCKGRTVIPGFVECHTHLVFSGDRSQEFEWRNQGLTYQEISKKGGGIWTTVEATRSAKKGELLQSAQARANRFLSQGVTTLEVKSGYGLSLESELLILQVAGQIKGPEIVRTFLGPHSIPKEFSSGDAYLDHLIKTVLPKVAKLKLAERADIFVESGFFSRAMGDKWLAAVQKHGLDFVVHADQLSALGSSAHFLSCGARSVDHALNLTDDEIRSIGKNSGSVVLLPLSDFYLRVPYPRARELISSGARIALASDFNPGTAPSQDLSLVGVLARLEMKMALSEVLQAYTLGAAYALGRETYCGALIPGYQADFSVLDGSWRDLFYEVGRHPIESVWRRGQKMTSSKQ